MLSYDVPMLVIVLITLLTDLYTFVHINYYKHCSTYQEENNFLNDKCKVCNTHCNDQCIVGLKVDIPLKSTSTSCILLTLDFMILLPLQYFILPLHNSTIKVDNLELLDIIASFFFNALNIPMIVSLSKKNNFANLSIERQRINTLAWNRTHNRRNNQQLEIKFALENRIQHQQA